MEPLMIDSGLNATFDDYEENSCEYFPIEPLNVRIILVGLIGTSVSIFAIIENGIFFLMLFKKRSYRNSHNLYIALIALFDFLIAMAYIPLMSISVFADYFLSYTLLKAWFTYMSPTIMVSHCAMAASSFLMVAASYERYRITCDSLSTKILNKNRVRIATFAITLGVLVKITHPFEIDIKPNNECIGTLNEWNITKSDLTKDTLYDIWKSWIRNVITIFIPFLLLTVLNLLIVLKVRENEFQFLSAQKISEMKKKSRTRAATRTMLFVVLTYLLSNILNVVISVWEYLDVKQLEEELYLFYTIATDVISLSTIIAGAARPLIYMGCQAEFRSDIINNIKLFCHRPKRQGYSGASVIATEDSSCGLDELDERQNSKPVTDLFMRLGTVLLVEKPKEKDSTGSTNHIIRSSDIIL